MLRSELREPVEESGGWSVIYFLQKREKERDDMSQAQQDVLALGEVFMNCQWDGVYLAVANLGPSAILRAIEAARRVGRTDMAGTLGEALELIPGGYLAPDEEVSARMMSHYDDPVVRGTFEAVEGAWEYYSLMLDEFIEQNSEQFFIAG
jgi:hypothetical protein